MTSRLLMGIILSIVLLIEVLMFVSYEPPPFPLSELKEGEKRSWTDFVGVDAHYEGHRERANKRYAIIIGTTLVIGTILTFSMPGTPIQKVKKSKDQEDVI